MTLENSELKTNLKELQNERKFVVRPSTVTAKSSPSTCSNHSAAKNILEKSIGRAESRPVSPPRIERSAETRPFRRIDDNKN